MPYMHSGLIFLLFSAGFGCQRAFPINCLADSGGCNCFIWIQYLFQCFFSELNVCNAVLGRGRAAHYPCGSLQGSQMGIIVLNHKISFNSTIQRKDKTRFHKKIIEFFVHEVPHPLLSGHWSVNCLAAPGL